jgi:hypothetical protein
MSSPIQKRTNPFLVGDRINFPSLDEFFVVDDDDISGNNGVKDSYAEHSFQSTIAVVCEQQQVLDLSIDISIGDMAELAHHHYQVQKYGIDKSSQQGEDTENSRNYDWDCIMDPDVSNDNLSSSPSTDIPDIESTNKENNSQQRNASRLCRSSPPPSSIGSSIDCNDSSGSSFFDKSIIQSLRTPDKIICNFRNIIENERVWSMTTTTRRDGILQHDNDSSLDEEDSPNQSSNDSSPDRVLFEKRFATVLHFHDNEFNERTAFVNDNSKEYSVYSADTSFDQQELCNAEKAVKETLMGLDLLQTTSRIDKQNIDEDSCAASMKSSNLQLIETTFEVDLSKEVDGRKVPLSSLESICPSPQMSPIRMAKTDDDTSCLFGLSPIRHVLSNDEDLTPPAGTTYDNKCLLEGEDVEESQSDFKTELVCTKRNLFGVEDKNPSSDHTVTTIKTDESYVDNTTFLSSVSGDMRSSSFSGRKFGSNVASRINSNEAAADATGRKPIPRWTTYCAKLMDDSFSLAQMIVDRTCGTTDTTPKPVPSNT